MSWLWQNAEVECKTESEHLSETYKLKSANTNADAEVELMCFGFAKNHQCSLKCWLTVPYGAHPMDARSSRPWNQQIQAIIDVLGVLFLPCTAFDKGA